MEKSLRVFDEGTRVTLASASAYREMSSLEHSVILDKHTSIIIVCMTMSVT